MSTALAQSVRQNELFNTIFNQNICVTVCVTPESYTRRTSNLVDSIWRRETTRDSSKHDETVLCYSSHHTEKNQLFVSAFPIKYRYVYAQLTHPDINLKLRPLGVSGIVTDDIACLIGQRFNVTEYAHCMEFAPSGSANIANAKSKSFNFEKQILDELSEEVRPLDLSLKSITPLGLIYDRVNCVFDIACKIQVSRLAQSALSMSPINKKNIEYKSIQTISLDKIHREKAKLIPSSQGILDLLSAVENSYSEKIR